MVFRIWLWVLVLLPLFGTSQTFKVPTVYAGVEMVHDAIDFSTGRMDNVFYFRTDGSFTETLYEEKWKSIKDGSYKLTGKHVILEYVEEREKDTLFLDADGKTGKYRCCGLSLGWATMVKMKSVKEIPAGLYSYETASSLSATTDFAQTKVFSNDDIYFLADKRFTRDKKSMVALTSANTVLTATSDDSLTGSYTVTEGVLTLLYDDGEIEKGSFFLDARLMDGRKEKAYLMAFKGDVFVYLPTAN